MSTARLTSTSYVILGLLCVQPWSAYELVQQMERGWDDFWPRAARGIYNEPKKLVQHGLVRDWTEHTGRRSRAVYQATPDGERAFAEWLAKPSQPPVMEAEALVRVVLADQAGLEELRAAVAGVREHAEARCTALLAQGTTYLESGGPFQDRLHLLHLTGGFLAEYYAGMLRWARWAESHIAAWEGVEHADHAPDLERMGRQVHDLLSRALAGVPTRVT